MKTVAERIELWSQVYNTGLDFLKMLSVGAEPPKL
jgi:hypothetical protein